MLEICAIASGSNGNCYYIGNEKGAILIDAGISAKQIVLRMKERGLNPAKLKAAFISHEHGDHMRGVRGVSKKLQVPIYVSSNTYFGAYKNMRPDNPVFFVPNDKITIGDFNVFSFLKNHDAAEPYSFRVEFKGKNVGVFTDIGEACENVINNVKLCNALFLETNYDEKMLWDGSYPYFLKKRVASEVGHLSNDQAFNLLDKHANKKLQCVFLSHISKENNTPEKANELLNTLTSKTKIKLTSRYTASDVFLLK